MLSSDIVQIDPPPGAVFMVDMTAQLMFGTARPIANLLKQPVHHSVSEGRRSHAVSFNFLSQLEGSVSAFEHLGPRLRS